MKVSEYIGSIKIDGQTFGTGFVVREDGIVATCYHVIKSAQSEKIKHQLIFELFSNRSSFAATLKEYDEDYDIALLTLESPTHSVARLISSHNIELSMSFSITGYGLLNDPKGHTYSYVSAKGDFPGPFKRDGIELIEISSKQLLPGMSGSPLIVEFNGEDCVVGMVSGRYSIDPSSGSWFEHSGWAIGSEYIERLLSGLPLDFERPGEGVFLSYSSKDVLFVKKFYDDLQLRGVKSIWMDRNNLNPGEDWEDKISKAIVNDCSHLIVCASQASLSSTEVQKEYEIALKAIPPKHVIPVIIDDTLSLDKLPPLLKKLNASSIPRDGYEKTIIDLILDGNLPRLHYILPQLIHVPSGKFTMGDRLYTQELDLPEFWIGKTSVTVREYICFVEAGGYESEKYWLPGTYDKWRSGPLYRNWPAYDLTNYTMNHPLQPMRGITWYEAMAYCNWLSYVSGHEFTLPTVAQWEKAARGIDKRKWAFGNDWKPAAADVKDVNGSGRPHPKDTGIAGSESPYGCQDMIGHVWNWTLTIECEPLYINDGRSESIEANDVEEPRVIRSGSWLCYSAKAAAYHREDRNPIDEAYKGEIGLRLLTNINPSHL